MRDLQRGETVTIEDLCSAAEWAAQVERAAGGLVVATGDQAPPMELKPNSGIRLCFSDQRWFVKVRGRILERAERTLKIALVGSEERVQRRAHMRVPLAQQTHVTVMRKDRQPLECEMLDISEGGCALRAATPFKLGEWLQVNCVLNGTALELAGSVVRAWDDGLRYCAGLRASGASPAVRYAISRYVIEHRLATARSATPGATAGGARA